MDPILGASLISGASNLLGGIAGGDAAARAAEKAADVQRRTYDDLMRRLEAIGVPSVEAQKIALESPELVGELEAQILGDSELTEISLDPRLRDAQMAALNDLRVAAEEGLTAQDLYQRDRLLDEESARMQAERSAMEQSMAERGMLDSGAQLAAQLASMQQSADRGQDAALELAAQRQQARRQALQALGQQSGALRSQEFGEQARVAQAQDEIARMNAAARTSADQFNIRARQNIENQRADIANRQEMFNKQLLQQRYDNQLRKLGVAQGIAMPAATAQSNILREQGAGQARMYQGIGSAIGDAASAFGAYKAEQGTGQNKKG